MTIEDRLRTLAEHSSSERHPAALSLARELKAELLAATSPDPALLGWVRDYELRSLFHLGRHAEGLALLEGREPAPFVISAKNAAWLHSVGGEMALRSGAAPERIVHHALRAFELRLEDEDVDAAATALQTGRALLREAGRPDLADAFTTRCERVWQDREPGSGVAMRAGLAVAQAAREPWYLADLPSADERRAQAALVAAAGEGRRDEVRELLDQGLDPDAVDPRAPGLPTALIASAFRGHLEVVERLIGAGAELDFANIQGRTALHLAADQGHHTTVWALVRAGSDIRAADFHGHTALHVAAWQDHLEVCRILLEAGSDLHRGDINGDAPLALAAGERETRVLALLIEWDPDLERRNEYGQTALHRAAMQGSGPGCSLLLEAGADPEARDCNGMTPLDWAGHEGHPEAVLVLLGAGSRKAAG